MSRRVGYVVKRFPRASETFIAQEILELERQGTDVRVFTLWPNDNPAEHRWLQDLQAPVVHCGDTPLSDSWKWLHRLAAARPERRDACEQALAEAFRYPDRRGRHRFREGMAVAAAALDAGIEHLHAHFANDPAFVAYLAHLVSEIPFSFTGHAKDLYAKALPDSLLRRIVDHAAFAVTVSEDNRRFLAQALGSRLGAKVMRLYNGVDLEEIEPSERADDRLGIVCVARLIEKKGVDSLLAALGLLDRKGVDFRATIIGDGPERPALEAQASAEGLEDRVQFTGTVPHEKVVESLRQHDVFVLPSRVADDGDQDALPTVLLEAMATGMPCLSTPVGGIPEIVIHQTTGLIVPSDRPLILAEAIADLEKRPRLRSVMGSAARRRVTELFDLRQSVRKLLGWFERASQGELIAVPTGSLRAVGR